MDYVSDGVFEEILSSVLEERFPETESLTKHVADENTLANTRVDHGQVGQVITLFTTRVATLAADKHVIAKLPLVPFVIINLTRLTAGVCMKVIQDQGNQRLKSLGPGYSQRWFQSRGLYVSNKCVYSSFTISFTMFHSQDLNKFRPELKFLIHQYLIHSTEIQ